MLFTIVLGTSYSNIQSITGLFQIEMKKNIMQDSVPDVDILSHIGNFWHKKKVWDMDIFSHFKHFDVEKNEAGAFGVSRIPF